MDGRVPGELSKYLSFNEYVKDETGKVTGVEFTCNPVNSGGRKERTEVLASVLFAFHIILV